MAKKKSPLTLTEMALALEQKKREVVRQAATDLAFRLANGESIDDPEIKETLENLKMIGPERQRGRKPGSRTRPKVAAEQAKKQEPSKPAKKESSDSGNEVGIVPKKKPEKASEKTKEQAKSGGQFLNDEDY